MDLRQEHSYFRFLQIDFVWVLLVSLGNKLVDLQRGGVFIHPSPTDDPRREALVNISQREEEAAHLEFGHFIWAWWELGRAWADEESGIPRTKNNRLHASR